MTDEDVYRTCADAAITSKEGLSYGILNDGSKLACLADWRIIEGWANAMPVAGRTLRALEGRSVQFFNLPENYVFPEQWDKITRERPIS